VTAPATPVPLAVDPTIDTKPAGLWRDTLTNVLRQRSAVVGLVLLTILVLVAILAPVLAPFDPDKAIVGVDRLSPPCIHALGCPADKPEHLLGIDSNFRDILSRVMYGARTSLAIGLAAIGFAILVGGAIGAIAGYVGGTTDNVLMRLMDVILAFPSLLLAIAIVTAAGASLVNALFAIGIVSIPVYARVVRSSVVSTRENDYVTASRALGESSLGILLRRVLPNSLTPLIVQATLGIGGAVLEIAALAFVGATGDLSRPEWGSMIAVDRAVLFRAPYVILAPGLAITLTVLAFNLLGDGLRDALDPRLNR